MRQWINLYENFQSNISGEFEESGWVYIESIEWVEMMDGGDGLMGVNFAATHYNKEWTEAAKDQTAKYAGMTVPPFIDEDQLWIAISNFLEAEGYKNLGAQFDIYGGSWYGGGINISVSDDIVAQGKSLLMKKRFKKESVNESFEETGQVVASNIIWDDHFDQQRPEPRAPGRFSVYFDHIEKNKEWLKAWRRYERGDVDYQTRRVPPFIDEMALRSEIKKLLEKDGLTVRDMDFQIEEYEQIWQGENRGWTGRSVSVITSNTLANQVRTVKMKKRFKKESVNENSDRWLEEDEFMVQALSFGVYAQRTPNIYNNWHNKYRLSDIEFDGKENIMDEMNVDLKKITDGKIRVIDIGWDSSIATGIYKIQHSPPKNFRQK